MNSLPENKITKKKGLPQKSKSEMKEQLSGYFR